MRSAPLLLVLVLSGCAAPRAMERRVAPGELAAAPEGGTTALEADRAILRTAFIQVEREDPEQGPAQATALVKAHGGYVERLTEREVTARVPAERLDGFLTEAPRLGTVARQSVTAEDVTDTRRDWKVRLDNLARVRDRYLELLQRASNVNEAVTVERELERVTAEYESLKARVESLEGQVALATVRLEFDRPVRPGPVGWVFYGLAKGFKWLFVWD